MIDVESLEKVCIPCRGTGNVNLDDTGNQIQCEDCRGAGYMPTDDGMKLIQFIMRHGP